MRGDIYRLPRPRGADGHEQDGARYAVALQSDYLTLSTLIVAPTSTRARRVSFRPAIQVRGESTCLMMDQLTAVNQQRLGEQVGRLTSEELQAVSQATRQLLALDLPW